MLALIWGSFAFLLGLALPLTLADVVDEPRQRLFDINVSLGSAIVLLTLGGFIVWQAASALGGSMSGAMRQWLPWPLLVALPVLIVAGQLIVEHPGRAPWLFPFINVGIVSIPSLVAGMTVARRYARSNPFSWPMSWREWTGGVIYGAIGATTVAAIINTLYLVGMAIFLISHFGSGDTTDLERNLPTLPRGWGIFFDVSVLSIVAPINEEFWKGMLVALFFFRRGGAARCFCWGVLAGAGFNLIETFQNSLSVVSPEIVADRTIGSQWWLFALARAGAGTMHACASGFSALGIYGILRHRWRFAPGYLAGIFIHGSWNFMVYVNEGDVFFSKAGPDSNVLDVVSVLGLLVLFASAALLLWEMPKRLRDEAPAPIYQALGMLPGNAPPNLLWPRNPFAVRRKVRRPAGSTGPWFTT